MDLTYLFKGGSSCNIKSDSEEEPKFITLFDKGFKIIKTCIMTHMDNVIKYCTFFWRFHLFPC